MLASGSSSGQPSRLAGQRVLVTGGSGFLGHHLQRALEDFGPSRVDAPRRSQYDLRKAGAIKDLLREKRPQIVIHLAAVVGGIGANRENPGRYFYENLVMGAQLMEEARKANVEKFVSIGTICSYPKYTPVPFSEDALWDGYPEETNAPYGLAKKMLLVQGQAYRQQYGFNAITLLPVNLYGPGDNFDPRTSHVIPALIRKVVTARDEGRPSIEVWGSGTASREFLFVRDAAHAICLATDRYDSPEPVNLGSGHEISIRELTELICELCGYEGRIEWDTSKPDGQPRRCLDTARARGEFGFQAETSLRDGIVETIEWFQENQGRLAAAQADEDADAGSPQHDDRPQGARRAGANSPSTSTAGGEDSDAAVIRPAHDSAYSAADSPAPRRALITGITGQDGSYLAELLLAKGYEVHGIVRRASTFNTQRLDHVYEDPHSDETRLFLHYGDLTDGQNLTNLVLNVEPDEIYNLAAQSHVRVSFDQPAYTLQVTGVGALNVLEAARQLNRHHEVRVYQASSSEMFGDVVETPQSETTPFRPCSPYGCAKVYAYYQTVNYRQAYGLFAANGILFNHESPRRGETFVTRKITRAAARIKLGLQDTLYLGNLDARRDWGFAKDYVEAMWLMLQHEEPEDFVIATGEMHSVREFLDLVFQTLQLDPDEHVRIDPRYMRPSEVNLLQGDYSKAAETLGWEPATPLPELVRIMVEHDLAEAEREAQMNRVQNG